MMNNFKIVLINFLFVFVIFGPLSSNTFSQNLFLSKPISSISIYLTPENTMYIANKDKFDPTGLKLNVTYGDGQKEKVEYNDDTKNDFSFVPSLDTVLKKENKIVTVTYGGKTAKINIEVVDILGIEITNEPSKKNYFYKDKLDTAKMIVSVLMGSEAKEIDSSQYKIKYQNGDFFNVGDTSVEVCYSGFSEFITGFTVKKAVPTIEDILPCGSSIQYGDKLAASVITYNPSNSQAVDGAFQWKEINTIVTALGEQSFPATFIPTDSENYEQVEHSVSVTVMQMKLLASPPSIAKSKAYDGNKTAAVTVGNIQNKVGNDGINLTATAEYDNSSVGENKIITVKYSLDGSDKDNYVVPDNFITDDGIITENQADKPTFEDKTVSYSGEEQKIYASKTVGIQDITYKYENVKTSLAASPKDIGKYKVTANLVMETGYAQIPPMVAYLTIISRDVTVAVKNLTKTYGEENPAFEFDLVDGIYATGDSIDSLELSATTTATKSSHVGKYPLTLICGNENYRVALENNEFSITPKYISDSDVDVLAENVMYTGSGVTTDIMVNLKGINIVLDKDCYSVEYENNVNIGTTAKAKIKFTGNYLGSVEKHFEILANPITILEISGIIPPKEGNKPVNQIIETSEFAGNVAWMPNDDIFKENTTYIATITLNNKYGYDFHNITDNCFKINGADNVSNAEKSNIITAVFPKTLSKPVVEEAAFTISVSQSQGGYINPETVIVTKYSNQKFTIIPSEGYEIEAVLTNGKSVGKVSEYTFENITSHGNISAIFKKINKFENKFVDVFENDWYYDGVQYVQSNGLMTGVSNDKFMPQLSASRAMAVETLYRLENHPNVTNIRFDDVKETDYFANASAWAKSTGIVNGMSNNKFMPNYDISREQLVTMLYRYCLYKNIDVNQSGDLSSFADVYEVSQYSVKAMEWAINNNIIDGKGNNKICPLENTKRCEVAVILQRFIQNIIEK